MKMSYIGSCSRNLLRPVFRFPSLFVARCSNSADSDDDTKKSNEKKTKSAAALKKLNLLLEQMVKEEPVTESKPTINLAKPKNFVKGKKQKDKTLHSINEGTIIQAVKNVAEAIGEDQLKVEDILMKKIITGGNPVEKEKETPKSLKDLLFGMEVEKTGEPTRSQQVRKILKNQPGSKQLRPRKEWSRKDKIDLFGSEPLGIFCNRKEESLKPLPELKTWNSLLNRELKLSVTHPPSNYFQQMIQWTSQGKIWKFPIDNEQGMTEEQNVSFSDHIFLNKHLEPWCPHKGPIRHFMELVCVGLSKNPYIGVEHKKEHILWFRDYFLSKKDLLQEVGAIAPDGK